MEYQGSPDLTGGWIGNDEVLLAEIRAAACLINAAPDLLASIEPAILDAAAEACERAGVFAAEMADVARELRAQASAQRAAIAKATGAA